MDLIFIDTDFCDEEELVALLADGFGYDPELISSLSKDDLIGLLDNVSSPHLGE